MEHTVLGISKDASLNDARRALRRIRTECHPDRLETAAPEHLELAKKMRECAEIAFERLESVANEKDTRRTVFPSIPTPFDLSREFVHPALYKNSFHQSYHYSNVNGVVRESGTINGRKMTEKELSENFLRGGLL